MSLLAWSILGLVAGLIASRLVGGSRATMMIEIVVSVAGAVVGGWLFDQFGRVGVAGFNPFGTFGRAGVAGFNLYSLCMAVVGAALSLTAYRVTLTLLASNFRTRNHIMLASSPERIERRVAEGNPLLMGKSRTAGLPS